MKILYQNRPRDLWVGGDMVQLDSTMEAVKKKGIDVEFNEQPIYTPALFYRHFDIIHLFNFSMEWTKWQLNIAKLHNKPVVCSMIYHARDNFVSWADQQKMADFIDIAVFLTEGEVERFKRHLKIDDKKIRIIPNGIDKFWFSNVVGELDIQDFVLTVGRVDGTKGQLETAKACKRSKIKYINIGDVVDEDYHKLCTAFGMINFKSMKKEDLIKFYAKCKIFVLASKAEIFPLSVMEAGAQAKNIVLTETSEWKDVPNVLLCKNDDYVDISNKINQALLKTPNLAFKSKLEGMTWDFVADELIKVYKELCDQQSAS